MLIGLLKLSFKEELVKFLEKSFSQHLNLYLFSSVDINSSNEGLKKPNLEAGEGNDKLIYLVVLDILLLTGNHQSHQHFLFQYVRLLHVGCEKNLSSRYFLRIPRVILYTHTPER